jgi:hypothetical protein
MKCHFLEKLGVDGKTTDSSDFYRKKGGKNHVALDTCHWQATVNTVMNLRV